MNPEQKLSLANQLAAIQADSGMSIAEFNAAILALAQNNALRINVLNKGGFSYGKIPLRVSKPIETGFD
jgi:hypothetical protein